MDKWLANNTVAKGVALAVAFMLWFILHTDFGGRTAEAPPVYGERWLYDVPVRVLHDDGAEAEAKPERVKVRLFGTAQAMEAVRAADVVAVADVRGRSTGRHAVSLLVAGLPPGVVGTSDPRTVQVNVVRQGEARLPVAVRLGRPEAPEAWKALPPDARVTVTPSEVRLSGPESAVRAAKGAYALLPPERWPEAEAQGRLGGVEAPLVAVDAEGRPLSLRLEPAAVRLDVVLGTVTAVLPVELQLTGAPADGYQVLAVRVTPATVRVKGSPEVLAKLKTVPAGPLSIAGARADVVAKVPLHLPPGVASADGSQVEAAVGIGPREGEATFTVPLKAPAPPGHTVVVQGDVQSVEIVVRGDPSAVQAIRPEALRAVLPTAGLSAGSYTLAPAIDLPPGVTLVRMTPPAVDVEIRPAPEAAEPAVPASGEGSDGSRRP
ncbi:CdaR family protein [Hydrogenibacillus schlegelii]|uniref:Secreted protein associated with spyDAC n=1 Tax=Hydrogenibacillus schlegelii TaxID=1484 RepID=A0A132N7F6_HYDSH|nr:CdaR family protein [Hydrogenibacillus schlegelii]KWX06058.1 hypothetical protein TR75_07195 [Hydrogenibacillus schlegelii]MBT9282523.1 hypothetical protein [Hydrogenibacillus schlegelii]OAR04319.1 hypothetical protein SA87_05120 [Hydrogenibacillus schlegelii]